MKDFLKFDKMFTPIIIEIIFWIGIVMTVLTGLGSILAGLTTFAGGAAVIGGLITIIVGPIFIRVWCELMLLAFKIYESLKNIEGKLNVAKTQEVKVEE